MTRFLAVGVAAVDIINETDGYPPEDSETRVLAQRVTFGGNAANTACVLRQLGHDCGLAASLAPDGYGRFLRTELERAGIDCGPCETHADGRTPVSYITVNRRNGSRTILHYRDLPEYPAQAFDRVDPSRWDWVHFEGRNVPATRRMLERLRERAAGLPVSLEIEKPRDDIASLIDLAGTVVFSGDYARAAGFDQPMRFLESVRQSHPGPLLVCTWGDRGAVALAGAEHYAGPAQPPEVVVDTVGAGDTFNAGLLHALAAGEDPASALEAACRLAGRKCGRRGLAGLLEP